SSYVKAMIELRADVELKDTNVVAMPKLISEGSIGRSSYVKAMIELRADVELKDTNVVVMPKLISEGSIVLDVVKNLSNPRQATRGVSICSKVSLSTKQIYIRVSNKSNTSTSGKRKQAIIARQEVSNSNPFDALNLIENDDELGLRRGIDSGYDTNSSWEQWKETKKDDANDPYDDDLYDSHDM
nr:hypothetical protein [Tanacetum cinerariifolium]